MTTVCCQCEVKPARPRACEERGRMIKLRCSEPAVLVRADELLWIGDDYLIGMSLAGSSVAIRGLKAAMHKKDVMERPVLQCAAPHSSTRILQLRWRGTWSAKTTKLGCGQNMMHLVAVAPGGPGGFLALRTPGEAPERSVYRAVLRHTTTPLLPIDRDGQPMHETVLAEQWATAVGSAVMREHARSCHTHPDARSDHWAGAMWIQATEEQIDATVKRLMKQRQLPME